jgi:hypothetical protein
VQGEVERARQAMTSPRAAGEYAGSMVDPMRIAAALRKTAPIAELDVYHGTPHRFEPTEANPLGEFDASKVGTGEGAQAYGRGIYLAENPEIARSYQNKLQRQGKTDSSGQLDLMMERLLPKTQSGYEVKGIIYPNQKDLIDGIAQGLIKQGDIPNDLYSAAKSYTEPGSFYKADLPDEMIDRMLDWDKSLLEQPPAVRKALRDAKFTQIADEIESSYLESLPPEARALALKMINGPYEEVISHDGRRKGKNLIAAKNWDDLERLAPGIEHNEIFRIRNWHSNKNAPDFYAELSRVSDKEASERLRQAGIPGIRYLDAGSRGKDGTGTRNFVVFPGEEKKVRILERDGQKAPPQKIAQALEATPTTAKRLTALPTVNPGDVVDGYKVRPDIPNQSSIAASFDNYEVLPGIRSINMTDFDPQYVRSISPDKLDSRTRKLMNEISQSKELNPLIVAYDSKGPYIIEGAHRFDALIASKAKKVPAMVVIDMDDPPK